MIINFNFHIFSSISFDLLSHPSISLFVFSPPSSRFISISPFFSQTFFNILTIFAPSQESTSGLSRPSIHGFVQVFRHTWIWAKLHLICILSIRFLLFGCCFLFWCSCFFSCSILIISCSLFIISRCEIFGCIFITCLESGLISIISLISLISQSSKYEDVTILCPVHSNEPKTIHNSFFNTLLSLSNIFYPT